MNKWIVTMLVAGVALVLTSTAAASNQKVIGKWKLTSMADRGKVQRLPPSMIMMVEFKAKTYTMTVSNNGKVVQKTEGTYTYAKGVMWTKEKGEKTRQRARVIFTKPGVTVKVGPMVMTFVRVKSKLRLRVP